MYTIRVYILLGYIITRVFLSFFGVVGVFLSFFVGRKEKISRVKYKSFFELNVELNMEPAVSPLYRPLLHTPGLPGTHTRVAVSDASEGLRIGRGFHGMQKGYPVGYPCSAG